VIPDVLALLAHGISLWILLVAGAAKSMTAGRRAKLAGRD
jgi:hypothetical protein